MRKLAFCFGNNRNSLTWLPGELTYNELYTKMKTPLRTHETAAQYHKMTKAEKQEIKDKGGFVAGKLKGKRRKKSDVICRSMITLDCDSLKPSFFQEYEENHRYASLIYTTHTHLPDFPRARLLIPFTRDVTPEEYNAIIRYLADSIGMEKVDPCSFLVNQMMYWPTCPSDGEYICRRYDGDWLDPDLFLAEYPDWRNCLSLPAHPSEKMREEREYKKQADPLSKEGIVGVFCRTYTIQDVMRSFLSHVYEETTEPDRWTYIPGEGTSGVVIYSDKYAYSHHATDPAGGMLLNAFDLVRVHLFDNDDAKKSMKDMIEFASNDENVRALSLEERRRKAGEDFADAEDENDSWKDKLVRQKKSMQLENSLFNIKLIMQNDPFMKHIVFNQLADGMEIKGEVPWKHPGKFWRDADDAQLICYVDDVYGTFSQRNFDIAVTKAADDRAYHPIRDYFESLPEWDGVKRVDTLLTDYLGAADNAYTQAVIRKTLCAAYMRVYNPGIKFDYMPVLNGDQGIGKSTFISNLGMEWFSDSLSLSDMNDKTAAEKLQGYWIIEIGELAGMKKADIDKVKAFISRQDDKYRASFGRRVTPHPRQCVFFGTTNSENGYLRDITGNRRFWNVKVKGGTIKSPWEMTPETIKQIWAETALLAKGGERLYLEAELESYAKNEQREAMEQDDREGLVSEYLDMLLPENWKDMDIYRRRDYVRDTDDLTRPEGIIRRMEVSNIEIWCECLGKSKEEMKPSDSYAISAIMTRIGGWEKSGSSSRIPIYGKQRLYRRK